VLFVVNTHVIGLNFILKNAKFFSERNAKISPEILKNEMISLSYDVNIHVYSKSK